VPTPMTRANDSRKGRRRGGNRGLEGHGPEPDVDIADGTGRPYVPVAGAKLKKSVFGEVRFADLV
jgi:hypothetical protein